MKSALPEVEMQSVSACHALVSDALLPHDAVAGYPFLRSAHLEMDMGSVAARESYVFTDVTKGALRRIVEGCAGVGSSRAWRVTGDYGTGKTRFLLMLASVLSGNLEFLPTDALGSHNPPRLQPMLATGEREPLSRTILRAISVDPADVTWSNDDVLGALKRAVRQSLESGSDGILLVLDELGKNLEYAVRDPQGGDVYLLQRIAEWASRNTHGIVSIVVSLHQAIGAYAADLETSYEREWAKAAGRYEEIVFAHPLEQVVQIVSGALRVDEGKLSPLVRGESIEAMRRAVELGMYGPAAPNSMPSIAPSLVPLHPTILPTLVQVFRRFGQNERSLFGFLASGEPFGLLDHIERCGGSSFYQLGDLYDYFAANMSTAVAGGSVGTRWSIIDSIVSTTFVANTTEERILKTVALFDLIERPGFSADREVVSLCVRSSNDSSSDEAAAIEALVSRGALLDRGTSGGLRLWAKTSVDLSALFEEAHFAAEESITLETLCEFVASHLLVPRRHYVRTGTLRHVDVKLAPSSQLKGLLENQVSIDGRGPDLYLTVVLPKDAKDAERISDQLSSQATSIREGHIISVGEPVVRALSSLHDVKAWQWIRANVQELATDQLAREESSRQLIAAERRLVRSLDYLANLAAPSKVSMELFTPTRTQSVAPGRPLLALLSDECDRIYSRSPQIHNELLNRRFPSSAAVAARTKLVEQMGQAPDLPLLGMDSQKRPPEMALYLSVLQKGELHKLIDGVWGFRLPTPSSDPLNVGPTFEFISSQLTGAGMDALVKVPDIFEELQRPPFGIRAGLLPFLLATYIAANHQRVALYEDGTYIHRVGGEHLLRMSKEPHAFHLQYCGLEGVRLEVLPRLLHALKLEPRDAASVDLIDVVRPLTVFIAQHIPEFARRTKNLPEGTLAVRKALLNAREPVKLVFQDLPKACGLPVIAPELKQSDAVTTQLGFRLERALHDLRCAYPSLLLRLGGAIASAFNEPSELNLARENIARRAEALATAVSEPEVRTFAVRLGDRTLPEKEWIESAANLLSKRSPERWTDADEWTFNQQLRLLTKRFRRAESLHQQIAGTVPSKDAYRIEITSSTGSEACDIVKYLVEDRAQVDSFRQQLASLIADGGQQAVVAMIEALSAEISRQGPAEQTLSGHLKEVID